MNRLHDTALLILCCLAPSITRTLRCRVVTVEAPEGHDRPDIEHHAEYPGFLLTGQYHPAGRSDRITLLFPRTMAVAAPFILFRLKRGGFSGCRVMATKEGLLVNARR